MGHEPTELDCDDAMVAISALVDGEDPSVDPGFLRRHLEGCAGCRQFESETARGRRALLVGAAPEIADLSVPVARANAAVERRSGWSATRILLALVALSVIALSVPGLLLGEDGAAPSHEARHLGAFSMAYGIALLVIAYRPSRARAFLLVSFVLAMALLITAAADALMGHIPLAGELIHIPELLSLVLVWDLARRQPAPPQPDSAGADASSGPPSLRIVEGPDLPQ